MSKRYNRLLVLEKLPREKGIPYALVQCDCGTVKKVNYYSLKYGATQSCGCLQKEITSDMRLNELTGEKYGMLTVIKRAKSNTHNTRWLCVCTCGNSVVVLTHSLTGGITRSCGCNKRNADTSRAWTQKESVKASELRNAGNSYEDIAKEINRGVPATIKRISKIRKEKGVRKCGAENCNNEIILINTRKKYCSDRCRYRDNKRKLYKRRKEQGLCKQCGSALNIKNSPHCDDCKKYFRNRYINNKESN